MTPDKVCVISLARRRHRLAAFMSRWVQTSPDRPCEVIEAVDRPDDPAAGLYASHLAALDAAGDASVLVLEDDAVFRGFSLLLADPPADWQLLRLGGLYRTVGFPRPGSPWLPINSAGQTHAYVARRPGELAALVRRRATTNIAHALSVVAPGHYRLVPATVGQAAGVSDIDGTVRARDTFWD